MMWRGLVIAMLALSLCGCSSFGRKLKAFLGGKDPAVAAAPKSNSVKYSDSPNVYAGARRQYKRTTRDTLQQEASLEPQAGSLWVMEGQGSYLFAQNTVRMIGDPIGVTLEGEPKEQLQAKVDVIKKLWSKFEERQARLRAPASDEAGKDKAKVAASGGKEAGKDKAEADKAAQANAQASPDPKADFGVKTVPTRVVERTVDGNYRVKGTQPFMIGSREYKVIVTGIVRAEDFNEEGIGANKLLDAKYDVVSVRRKEQDL
ncbi:MAG: flagellar basal body L-ring protein FlgH [Bdellovibrionales bacterium]